MSSRKPNIDQLAKDSAQLDSIRQEIEGEGFEDMGDLHLTIRGAIKSLREERDGYKKAMEERGFDALRSHHRARVAERELEAEKAVTKMLLEKDTTVVPEPKHPTLWRYLDNANKKGIAFLRIGVNRMPDGGYHFYIHPDGRDGETEDYLLWPDPFNWHDMLVNKKDSTPPDVEKFKAYLAKQFPAPPHE